MTDDDGARDAAVRADRLRLLAALGGDVVHELANRLGVVVGIAEDFEHRLEEPAATRLRDAAATASASLELLRSVVRLLDRDPRQQQEVDLPAALEHARALLAKHSLRRCRAVLLELGDGMETPPRVRIDRADLLHALVTVALHVQRFADGDELRLRLERVPGAAAHGRPVVRVRYEGRAPGDGFAALLARLGAAAPPLPALRALAGGADELARIAWVLRRHGGDLCVVAGSAGPVLAIELPERR
ncbi:MAG: hypothetical protein AB7O97_02175 [Planctomycetota bacterium]